MRMVRPQTLTHPTEVLTVLLRYNSQPRLIDGSYPFAGPHRDSAAPALVGLYWQGYTSKIDLCRRSWVSLSCLGWLRISGLLVRGSRVITLHEAQMVFPDPLLIMSGYATRI